MLDLGSEWLGQQRTKHASSIVRYVRAAAEVELKATIGRTEFQVDNGYGLLERVESRDFLLLSADLVLGGNRVLPERGDKICEVVGAQVFVHEVLAPGKHPHWRYSDPYRRTLRIHTKHVKTEQAT